jgi:hypothetical protein
MLSNALVEEATHSWGEVLHNWLALEMAITKIYTGLQRKVFKTSHIRVKILWTFAVYLLDVTQPPIPQHLTDLIAQVVNSGWGDISRTLHPLIKSRSVTCLLFASRMWGTDRSRVLLQSAEDYDKVILHFKPATRCAIKLQQQNGRLAVSTYDCSCMSTVCSIHNCPVVLASNDRGQLGLYSS